MSEELARVALREDEARAVRAGRWVRVDLGEWVEVGPSLLRTRSALVGRSGGKTRAFANVCLHQPLSLDVQADPEEIAPGVRAAPMDDRRVHLLCHSHGAIYRTSDGLCTSGPCDGQSLVALEIEESAGGITVVVRAKEDDESDEAN